MLNPFWILRRSARFTFAGAVGMSLSFVTNILIARLVAPEELGEVHFVTLCLGYAGLLSLGAFNGAQRQVSHWLGRGDRRRAEDVQGVGLATEALCQAPIVAAVFLAAALVPGPLRRIGFVIGGVTFTIGAANRFLGGLHLTHQNFDFASRFGLIRALVSAATVVVTVGRLGALSILVGALLSETVLMGFLLRYAPPLGLKLRLDRKLGWELIAGGFPLALMTLVYWAYRLCGQTFAAFAFPAAVFAYYSLPSQIVRQVTQIFGDFSGVLAAVLWKEIGERGSVQALHRESARITLFLMAASGAIANLAQAGFDPLARLLLPRFVASIPVLEVLTFNVVVLSITFVPTLVLDSASVNRQWPQLAVWAAGLAVNLIANAMAVRLGWGLLGLAWNDIWIQALVVVTLHGLAHRHLYPDLASGLRVYVLLGGLSALTAAIWLLLGSPWLGAAAAAPAWGATGVVLALRLLVTVVPWALVAGLLLRGQVTNPGAAARGADHAGP